MLFELTGTTFAPGDLMPSCHHCDGEVISSATERRDPPSVHQRLTMGRMAGHYVRWLVYNLRADANALSEGKLRSSRPPESSLYYPNNWLSVEDGMPLPTLRNFALFLQYGRTGNGIGVIWGGIPEQVPQTIEGDSADCSEWMGTTQKVMNNVYSEAGSISGN